MNKNVKTALIVALCLAGAGAGFQVSSTEVVVRGRCRECQQHHPTDPRPKEHAAHG